MFSMIRRRFTFANVVMTLALVFAMAGGAYAAKKYVITSTKQISPKVLKALQGKTGSAGPAGVNGALGKEGAPGKEGAAGKEGSPGEPGKAGESVISKEVKTSEALCEKRGGTSLTVAGKTENVCNGKEGSPWTASGTLPKGKTETGAWSYTITQGGLLLAPISFPISLAAELGENEVHYVPSTGNGTTCPGSTEKPLAEPGNLCVYKWTNSTLESEPEIFPDNAYFLAAGGHPGAGMSGAVIAFIAPPESKGLGWGSWAVTEK
jgi:hypothetical protein